MPTNQYGTIPGLPGGYSQDPNYGLSVPSGQNNFDPKVGGYGQDAQQANYQTFGWSAGPGNLISEQTTNPSLTGSWDQYLQSQIGKGASAFNLPTTLATGETTAPGQLNAPMNSLLQQLQQFFQTGQTSGGGGSSLQALQQLAGGTSAIPQWQADLAAMQQNIQQNQANLKEQFASTGALGGSEYGQAMQNYMQGTTASQNALLAQIQQQNQQTQLTAAQSLTSLQSQLGTQFQTMDQTDIQNMLQEFIRTQPEYSPLLQEMFGQANTYAPIASTQSGASAGAQAGSDAMKMAMMLAMMA